MEKSIKTVKLFAVLAAFALGGMTNITWAEKKAKAAKAVKPQAYKILKQQGVKKKDIDKAEDLIEFIIPKDMSKKMNAIQWTLKAGSKGRPILSGNQYQLVNMAINRRVIKAKRLRGADLGLGKVDNSKGFKMLIERKNGKGQLRYGDIFAMKLQGYGYIRIKKRKGSYTGINLGYGKKDPHYVWQIRGGKTGTKLVSGMPFALYNLKPYKTEVIYCQRTAGIDLGWRGKSKCGGTWAKVSGKAFGANGALSGDGLTGKLAKDWKGRLCKAGVGAASAYATAQTGGAGAAAVAAAGPKAIKECNSL